MLHGVENRGSLIGVPFGTQGGGALLRSCAHFPLGSFVVICEVLRLLSCVPFCIQPRLQQPRVWIKERCANTSKQPYAVISGRLGWTRQRRSL